MLNSKKREIVTWKFSGYYTGCRLKIMENTKEKL